jgi:regulator of protease activity HflC (stomatin/prohibitin superfamily)
MNQSPSAEAQAARPAGPPPPAPPGPIAQSVAIGFRAVYIATLLLALLWASTNVREIAPDSQAVVLRFGRIVRAQQAGLLIAWPRPIETVRLLPGPDRQLSQDVDVLPSESDKASAVIESGAQTLPPNVAAYLTGDGNVVLLNATLFYRISDPIAFALSESHVAAALDRAFRASSVRVAASRNLNDFLVVQNAAAGSGTDAEAQAITALRSEVRISMLQSTNARLQELTAAGSPLGIEVQRIDMTAWLPPQAKTAFDAVLTATQAADRGVAMARTDAERRRQEAEKESNRLLSAAEATAKELVASAHVDTANILAVEHEETPQTRASLLLHAYRDAVADIMNRVGSVTLIDPQSGARFVLPGKQK